MKLSCSQSDLALALSVVNRAVSPNNTLPVLNNILLTAEKGKLHMSATNLEIAINASLDANVKEDGAITVPAKTFSSYIPLLKDESVELTVSDGTTLEIKSTGSNIKMKGITSEEFPNLPKVEESETFVLPAKKLREATEQVVFAASTNISRPVLTGVLWRINAKGMKLVATDSYRLAEKTLSLEKDTGVDLSLIIPSRTTQELSKILASTEADEIEVSASKNQILFKVDGVELMSRLIDGNYPDYEKILPKKAKTSTAVSVEDLVLALKKVLVIVKENNNSVRMRLGDGKISISSEETQIGEGSAELSCTIEGGESEVSLNAQYLIDVLGHLNDDKVNLGLNDGLSPVMVLPASSEGYVHIIMPLKI